MYVYMCVYIYIYICIMYHRTHHSYHQRQHNHHHRHHDRDCCRHRRTPDILMHRPSPSPSPINMWENDFHAPPAPGSDFRDCNCARIETSSFYTPPLWVVVVVVYRFGYRFGLPNMTTASGHRAYHASGRRSSGPTIVYYTILYDIILYYTMIYYNILHICISIYIYIYMGAVLSPS